MEESTTGPDTMNQSRKEMDIFLSWSGERSKVVARALEKWLPKVLPGLRPWMSETSLRTGGIWQVDIFEKLRHCSIGILCLTRDNVNAPWIAFEAGSLGMGDREHSLVCPYLIDLEPSELRAPLSLANATRADAQGTLKLVQSIDKFLGGTGESVESCFEEHWAELREAIDPARQSRGLWDAFVASNPPEAGYSAPGTYAQLPKQSSNSRYMQAVPGLC
ncbi:MAG: TIR domain-containing protein [bacterium]|nr:TIR domain-containing protein [bacterium]